MSILVQSQHRDAASNYDVILESLGAATPASRGSTKKPAGGWALPASAIALAAAAMLAILAWASKAHLNQQQAALAIGLAVFVGTFFSAAVLVFTVASRWVRQPKAEIAASPSRTVSSQNRSRSF